MLDRCRCAWLLAAVLLLPSCATLREEVRVARDGVRFQLRRPEASSVAVVGDFNDWSLSAHPMRRSGDLWLVSVRLPPGEYLFMYVVDGTWITPPNAAEVVPDGFGGSNARVVVP